MGSPKINYYIFDPMDILRLLAFPLALAYAFIVYLRNKCYDLGVFKARSYSTPVVCIGNLSVGGTGKTPMVEYLVSQLENSFKVAVLSRGYKRKSTGHVEANALSTVEELGDEPFQIFKKFPKTIVVVNADRQRGIETLEAKYRPDVILLDDGFQHRKVKAGLNLVLTAYGSLYVDDHYLPTGKLRDHIGQAKRADAIIVTKCPENLSEDHRLKIKAKLNLENHQKLLFSSLGYSDKLRSQEGSMAIAALRTRNFTLVTGIADPTALLDYLKSLGLQFDHIAFGDHHAFSMVELQVLNTKELVLTTEKDYMRLEGKVKNLYYIEVKHLFLNEDEQLLYDMLNAFMKRDL